MPEMPAGIDRNTLVLVRPTGLPEGVETPPEHVVGAAFVTAFPDDVEFVRFANETPEQAEAREKAAAEAAKPAAKAPAVPRNDGFGQQ